MTKKMSTPRKPAPMKPALACCSTTSSTATPRSAWMSVLNAICSPTRVTPSSSVESEAAGEGHAPAGAVVGAGVLYPFAVGGEHAELPGLEDSEHHRCAEVVGATP